MIEPTSEAVRHLRELLKTSHASEAAGLRLGVEKGGCAGWQYVMKVDTPTEEDQVLERDGVRFFVSPESAPHLRGLRLDYVDSLNDSGFKVDNPNAVRSCGCGTSFETGPASP